MRRTALSLAMLVTGVALMVAAQLAGASPDRRGGVFRYGTTGASVQIDPQLSYISTGWWLEYATAAKLYNFSRNGLLVPEVASRVKISNGGTRYAFFLRKGFRFSDGAPVTAASFKYAITRVLNKDLASPAAFWITSADGTEIVGAKDVNDGRATDVSGVRVRGRYKLVIDLLLPDGKFLTILTMPFFQATSAKLPLTQEVANVQTMEDLPTAGPYAFALNDVNVATKLRRNPFWKRGPGRTAPRNLSGLDVYWNLNEHDAFEQVKSNLLDQGPIPAAEVRGVANQYGVNRSRFWVEPANCLGSIPFNTSSGLFANNAPMRQAVNWALDRTNYVSGAGPFLQSPWTHLLPPNVAGSITKKKLQPYATTSRIEKARAIAAGHFKDGRVIVAYRSTGGTYGGRAEAVRQDLIRLGFDPSNIEMKPFNDPPVGAWDLMVGWGWCVDLPDPASFIRGAYLPLGSTYEAKLDAADHLRGNARLKALGKLDLEITKKLAPVAVMNTYNNRYFFSSRVNPRSLKYHKVYQDWSIPELALK